MGLASLELYQRHQSQRKNVTIVDLGRLAGDAGASARRAGDHPTASDPLGDKLRRPPGTDPVTYRAAKSGTKSHVLLLLRRLDALSSTMYAHYS